jgi:hypothetical protein
MAWMSSSRTRLRSVPLPGPVCHRSRVWASWGWAALRMASSRAASHGSSSGMSARSTSRLCGPAGAAKRSATPSRWALEALCVPSQARWTGCWGGGQGRRGQHGCASEEYGGVRGRRSRAAAQASQRPAGAGPRGASRPSWGNRSNRVGLCRRAWLAYTGQTPGQKRGPRGRRGRRAKTRSTCTRRPRRAPRGTGRKPGARGLEQLAYGGAAALRRRGSRCRPTGSGQARRCHSQRGAAGCRSALRSPALSRVTFSQAQHTTEVCCGGGLNHSSLAWSRRLPASPPLPLPGAAQAWR